MTSGLEIKFLIGSMVFTGIACLFLLYQCISNFTKLRLACLVSTISVFFVSVCNYGTTQNYPWIPSITYWMIFALVRAIYTSMLVICMLDMGRRFYGEIPWNTFLFKFTILQLFAFDSVNIADALMIHLENNQVDTPLFLVQ
ncbi:14232_t:CDS:2, partial [Acaulospora morrowiae]